jgi:hypothetical protein
VHNRKDAWLTGVPPLQSVAGAPLGEATKSYEVTNEVKPNTTYQQQHNIGEQKPRPSLSTNLYRSI